ncbi:MAG: methyltransferase family protein [Candidatus Bathycorpusculaceae bacterium]
MFFPLAIYLFSILIAYPQTFWNNANFLLFSPHNVIGRIIAFYGLLLFLVAAIQFLRKRGTLIMAGVYSVVRHPQYLGIIILTLGYSLMVIWATTPPLTGIAQNVLFIWLVQVLGYIVLAFYEERCLLQEHKSEYRQYQSKVPFIFPTPCLRGIPEPILSFILALIIAFLAMLPVILI